VTRLVRSAALLAFVLVAVGCDYVVIPPEASAPVAVSSEGWDAVATGVSTTDAGDLRIDLAIENRTGDWSEMSSVPGKAAVLTGGDGATTQCETVAVGTGGHRLAPGFRVRGYVGGKKAEPIVEQIGVECAGATVTPGSRLAIDYRYATGEYNYYDPVATETSASLEVDLDAVASDLTYPIAEPKDGLIVPADTTFTAINDVVLTLTGVERAGTTLESSWETSNPGEYPSSVHIGEPPVLGSEGVLYGFYESPDLASVPITPAGETASWTTQVEVPSEVSGLVMLLSVESKKQRLFVNYAVDLSAE
jgi:hypothetical protein